MTVRFLWTIALLCSLCLAGGCGSNSGKPDGEVPADFFPNIVPGPSAFGELQRDSSGLPRGIRLYWDPVADGADEIVTGYHIYRSAESIPDSSRGDDSLWLVNETDFVVDETGKFTVFPSSLLPFGVQASYLDPKSAGFDLTVGETWFYRISALNDSGDEGLLSEEIVVSIAQHGVTSLSTYSAFAGEQLIVEGLRFGNFNAATDRVTFVGSVWNPLLAPPAFEEVDLDANVVTWSPTQILVEVPQGSTRGRTRVWIDKSVAFPLQEFVCRSPFIDAITPYARFLNESFLISGENFGPAFGPDNVILLDGTEVVSPDSYPIWSDTQISFLVPAGTPFGVHSLQIRNGTLVTDLGFINTLNRTPTAEFNMNKITGAVPLAINFNADLSTDPDDGIAEWKFEFGDGSSETRTDGSNLLFSHVYNSVGVKEVTLTVTDFAGATDSITKSVTVTPAADILLVGDHFNGAGPGNEFTANFIALTTDLDTLGVSYVVGGYSIGISQVAIDQGFKIVIWNRGGPGPGDAIQDWPRNWDNDEKSDFKAILDAGIPTLLLSQNHQFTADFSAPNGFQAKYEQILMNDTVVEAGATRDFPWAFGTATDFVHNDLSTGVTLTFPSSPVCLLSALAPPTLGRTMTEAAEQYAGPGASGRIPSTMVMGKRIQGAILFDATTAGGATHPGFISGMAVPDASTPMQLCFSYGLASAPDSSIGFAGNYTHNDGPAKLWVIGWSYSEAIFSPDPITRHDVLQNVLTWLDNSITIP
jgi:PKD repeat protein